MRSLAKKVYFFHNNMVSQYPRKCKQEEGFSWGYGSPAHFQSQILQFFPEKNCIHLFLWQTGSWIDIFFWKLSLGYSDVFRGFQWVFNNFCELWWCLCLLFLFVTVFILLRCWSLVLEALFTVINNCFLLFMAYITLVYLCSFHGLYFVT